MSKPDRTTAGPRVVASRYLLSEPLGAGGMGSVWRATDLELGRVVALKRAHPGMDDPDGRRLRREAKIGAGLHDPHVVTIFDVVVDGPDRWLVLEYLPSRSLSELIEQRGQLPPAEVARIGLQIAQALRAVHAAKVIHRDLKPANILVTEDGTAKLADFGISQRLWMEVTLTDTSTVGTPAQLAPEVANGDEPTPASDIFSLGAVLYTAVEGHSPFGTDPNPLAVLRKAARGEIEPSRRAGELSSLIARTLQVDPSLRPTAAQVVAELGGPASLPQPTKRRPWLAATVATGIAVAVTVTLLLINASSGTSAPQTQAGPVTAGPVGDVATADPCSLLDPSALERFGKTNLETDYGNFDRCDVIVKALGQREVDVQVNLDARPSPDLSPSVGIEQHNGNIVAIVRQAVADERCERILILSDRNRVSITARHTEGTGLDLCTMAETATKNAVSVLEAGQIPRRSVPFDASSLAGTDTCSLLDTAALASIPGVDGTHPKAGFGNWKCEWDSTINDLSVDVIFDRDQPLSAADGQPTMFSGHPAFIKSGGDRPDSCLARIVHRTYADPHGQTAIELVKVVVAGPFPAAELCRLTTQLGRAAAAKLPPT